MARAASAHQDEIGEILAGLATGRRTPRELPRPDVTRGSCSSADSSRSDDPGRSSTYHEDVRRLTEDLLRDLPDRPVTREVTGQAARFVDSIFSIVVPENGLERLAELLEKRPAAERLIQALEKQ